MKIVKDKVSENVGGKAFTQIMVIERDSVQENRTDKKTRDKKGWTTDSDKSAFPQIRGLTWERQCLIVISPGDFERTKPRLASRGG